MADEPNGSASPERSSSQKRKRKTRRAKKKPRQGNLPEAAKETCPTQQPDDAADRRASKKARRAEKNRKRKEAKALSRMTDDSPSDDDQGGQSKKQRTRKAKRKRNREEAESEGQTETTLTASHHDEPQNGAKEDPDEGPKLKKLKGMVEDALANVTILSGGTKTPTLPDSHDPVATSSPTTASSLNTPNATKSRKSVQFADPVVSGESPSPFTVRHARPIRRGRSHDRGQKALAGLASPAKDAEDAARPALEPDSNREKSPKTKNVLAVLGKVLKKAGKTIRKIERDIEAPNDVDEECEVPGEDERNRLNGPRVPISAADAAEIERQRGQVRVLLTKLEKLQKSYKALCKSLEEEGTAAAVPEARGMALQDGTEAADDKDKRTRDKKKRKQQAEEAIPDAAASTDENSLSDNDEPKKKTEKHKEKEREDAVATSGDVTSTAPPDPAVAQKWNIQGLEGGSARQAKYLKLLGGGKNGAGAVPTSADAGQLDMGRVQDDLASQFEAGVKMKFDGGNQRRGLGA